MNRWIKTKPSASKETCNPEAQYTCKFHHAQDTQPSAFRSDKPRVKLLHPLSVTSSCPGARSDPSDPPKEKKEPRGQLWRQCCLEWKLGVWGRVVASQALRSLGQETTIAVDPQKFHSATSQDFSCLRQTIAHHPQGKSL